MKTSLLLLVVGAVIGSMNFYARDGAIMPQTAVDWPSEFEGRPLEQLPLSVTEEAFAQSFPGVIGVFKSSGDRQVILRRVDRATRRLHDSATCLKAAGFSIEYKSGRGVPPLTEHPSERDGWLHYEARRDGEVFSAREQIVAGERTWIDVSDWFWHATFHRNSGPWLAVTVLELQ